MLSDVVVDTNVLLHADDARQAHQADALAVLTSLRNGETKLCVDEGFHCDTDKNRSLVGGEYWTYVTPAHVAYGLLAYLFASGRVKLVSRAVPRGAKKCVEQCVRDKRDRTFLFVAHNSGERVLCSQDLEDLQLKKRKHLRKGTGVSIMDAATVHPLLSPSPS
jgi:predicted nucleic acid-binding protein